jgi:hypothetical protein
VELAVPWPTGASGYITERISPPGVSTRTREVRGMTHGQRCVVLCTVLFLASCSNEEPTGSPGDSAVVASTTPQATTSRPPAAATQTTLPASQSRLELSATGVQRGDRVVAIGCGFHPNLINVSESTPVVLHWNRIGTILAQELPDKAGYVAMTFVIPPAQPGRYVIIATQRVSSGVDAAGTPARATIEVLLPGGRSVTPELEPPERVVCKE